MKLQALYESLSMAEREALASKAGIKAPYLWQLATQWKGKKPSLELLKKIADADKRLTVAELVEEFTASGSGSHEATHGAARRAPAAHREGPSRRRDPGPRRHPPS